MAPTPTSLNIPDISSVQDEEGTPVWNGDKTLLSLYLVVLERWLFKTHPDYRILFEKGYLVDRNGRVVVYSPDHATAIAGTPPTGYNFRNPAPRVPRSDTALTEPQRERFNRAPELIDVKDSTILDTVLGTITDQDRSDKLRHQASGSGRAGVQGLFTIKGALSTSIQQTIQAYRDAIEAAGIASQDKGAWSDFKRIFTDWNKACATATQHSDATMSRKFADAVNNLGERIEATLMVEMRL